LASAVFSQDTKGNVMSNAKVYPKSQTNCGSLITNNKMTELIGALKAKTHYCDPTRPDPTRPHFVGDPGRRPGSPTKSGRRQVCD